jgi:hypothetical protein
MRCMHGNSLTTYLVLAVVRKGRTITSNAMVQCLDMETPHQHRPHLSKHMSNESHTRSKRCQCQRRSPTAPRWGICPDTGPASDGMGFPFLT